ncbi:FKBP-type peptidyl-prolyl cis-trans isomerase fkpA precursor [Serratia fonticola]|uniref:FKBP-type peptidyl-prolyl cis-trans isomerase fkpA n=1 Tax=Serratia fonticola TaxID=47917 RepID=A0A3S4YG96_SERFO|nr:FKBP-type peptidyl-prolyl cis-trans isomerase fkpA precursor [Serratia fonticola]
MKSLFKVTLLATTMALALNATQVMAADAAKPADAATVTTTGEVAPAAEAAKPAEAPSTGKFKNDDEQVAYALGVQLGRYMENSLDEQEKLGIKLDKDVMLGLLRTRLPSRAS